MNIPHSIFQKESREPDTDPLGHVAWAAEKGISPDSALMLSATALAHIAGPTLDWADTDLAGKRPPSLLAAESDVLLRGALDNLLAYMRRIQHLLIHSSHEYPQEIVDEEYLRSCRKNFTFGEAKKFHQDAAQQPDDPFRNPDQEQNDSLERGFRMRHRESLLNPVFMADSLPPGPLEGLLLGCSHGACCVAGALENLPTDKTKRHKRVDELMRFMDGAFITPRQNPVVRVKHVSLRGIFLFRQDDLHWLLDERRDFLLKLIPIASNTPEPATDCDINPEKVQLFQRRFDRAAKHALALRRAFFATDADFRCEDARGDFLKRRRLHRLRSANAPTDLSTVPDLLMWFLLRLYPEHDERVLVDLAMDAVESVSRESCRTFALHDNMQLGLKRQQNARKMLQRINDKGPLKRHELVRIFNRQSLDVHAPVIDALIARGFLTEDDENRLHLGPMPASRLTMEHVIDECLTNPSEP